MPPEITPITPVPTPPGPQVPPNPATIPPASPKEESHVSPLKQIRTYEGDVAEAIKNQNESLISIQQAERKKKGAVETLAPNLRASGEHHVPVKPLLLSLLTIIFIVGGGYGAYYAWKTYTLKIALPPIEAPINQFVAAVEVTDVDASTLGRQSIIDMVQNARLKNRDDGAIEQLEMKRASGETFELLSTADFLTRLTSHAPAPLVRSFSDLFMLGVMGPSQGHTILLIRLESFENAFPGMLDWEPRMVEDLLPLFADGETVGMVPSATKFEDKTIQNHDTRILKTLDGRTVLIYGFFDNSMLVVTDEETAFRTLINRLQSQKLSR